MTEQELIQENEKLNARLQKAVTVFAEQKATIQRLTEERDAAVAKTGEAEKQDELFFEQQNEIETLKSRVVELTDEINTKETELKTKETEAEDLKDRLQKAHELFKTQKTEIQDLKTELESTQTELDEAQAHTNILTSALEAISAEARRVLE